MLRFQQEVSISTTRRVTCWLDVDTEAQNDISCPHVGGKIKVKVLRLPRGINTKRLPCRPTM